MSFNWATTFQPWIRQRQGIKLVFSKQFQLGHDFSAMDTHSNLEFSRLVVSFQLGHDFSAMDTALNIAT